MCGIVGIIETSSERSVDPDVLDRMTDALAHRGPDSRGVWSEDGVGLGHRRLAIVDPSARGRQPMSARSGRAAVLTYNGEIYNFRDLRAELKSAGHRFRSRTDTEVLLHAYLEWGGDCVDRLNGMFAFALWDRSERTLVLARDRYGVKPLYVHRTDGRLLFGSEIKAFLPHPDFSVAVDPHALLEYFTFQNVFSDRTLFEDVRMVPPGHCMRVTRAGGGLTISTRQYWDFSFREPEHTLSDEEYEEELDRLFTQAVRRQLVADARVGAYLSGGIDSGAITAIAAQERENLPTFTGGFDLASASGRELAFDERERAERVSRLFRTEHYEVVLKAGDMERVMDDLIWHLEDLRVGQCYPNYYVARLASKFGKVVLTGIGGDEIFAGYPWRYYRAVNNQSFDEYVEKYYRYWQRLVRNRVIQELFRPGIWREVRDHRTLDDFRGVIDHDTQELTRPEEYVNRSLYFEARTFLHGLLVVEDRLAMAHGLEARVPFLDNDLVDFATRLPVGTKLRNLKEVTRIDENEPGPKVDRYFSETNDGKLLLRRVLERYVPSSYANGRKQGFSAPDASWFRGESAEYVRDRLCTSGARIYDYLRPDTVRPLVREHLNGTNNRRLLIWSLLSFEHWLDRFDPS